MPEGDNGKGKFTEENNVLMANGRTKPANDKGKLAAFTTFIYNKKEGRFLGRTAKSWGQILVFYIIFYICLAAFWVACLAIFLRTLDPSVPRYFGKNTIIGANPGVGYQPWLKDDPESTLVRFNRNDTSSYSKYLSVMNSFWDKYDNTNGTRDCSQKGSNSEFVTDGKATSPDAEACRFDLSLIEKGNCGPKNNFGFDAGQPCIFLSINRLIGWVPEAYESKKDVPAAIKNYTEGSIAFVCEGLADADKEVLGKVDYIPPSGIESRYFPYAVMKNYHQPFAAVKFLNLPVNRVVMVKCSAYAKNIEQDEDSRAGMVIFELLRQDIPPQKKEP